VDGDGARRGVEDGEEAGDEGWGRGGAVVEGKGVVGDAGFGEWAGVVMCFVELHHGGDAHGAKNFGVVGRAELPGPSEVVVEDLEGAEVFGGAASDELAGDDYVDVAVEWP
jgi:hypothetical protein